MLDTINSLAPAWWSVRACTVAGRDSEVDIKPFAIWRPVDVMGEQTRLVTLNFNERQARAFHAEQR